MTISPLFCSIDLIIWSNWIIWISISNKCPEGIKPPCLSSYYTNNTCLPVWSFKHCLQSANTNDGEYDGTATALCPLSSWPRSEWRRTDEHQGFPDLRTRLPAAPGPDEIPPPGPAHLHRGSLYGRTVEYPVASLSDACLFLLVSSACYFKLAALSVQRPMWWLFRLLMQTEKNTFSRSLENQI